MRKALTSLTYDAQPISGTPSPSVGVSWTTKRGSEHIMYQRWGCARLAQIGCGASYGRVNGTPGSPHWTGLYRAKEQMPDDAERYRGTARSRVATLDGGSTDLRPSVSCDSSIDHWADTGAAESKNANSSKRTMRSLPYSQRKPRRTRRGRRGEPLMAAGGIGTTAYPPYRIS